MSFHASASDIRVDDGHILRATLLDAEGNPVEAEFDLNGVIGNNDGKMALRIAYGDMPADRRP